MSPDWPIFLSYTSGSTEKPKCVPRDHLTLSYQQIYALKYLPKLETDIHLCGYTVSAMHNLIEGSTTVLPQDSINKNLDMIAEQQVSRLSGPPGWIDDLVQSALQKKTIFPTVKSVLLGGAPLQKLVAKKYSNSFSTKPNHSDLWIHWMWAHCISYSITGWNNSKWWLPDGPPNSRDSGKIIW